MAGVDGCSSRLKWCGGFAGERPLAEVWTLWRCGVDQGSVDFALANPAQPNHCNSSRCMPLCNVRHGARLLAQRPTRENHAVQRLGLLAGLCDRLQTAGTRCAMKTARGGKGSLAGPSSQGSSRPLNWCLMLVLGA